MLNNKNLCFMSFWSINDDLDINTLKQQLDELKASGLDGVVFHPRYYTNNPEYLGDEYMKIVSELILYAKKIEMKFWVYDENGYPSGVAGGKVMELHPEYRSEYLVMVKEGEMKEPVGGWFYSFRIHEGKLIDLDASLGELFHIYKVSYPNPSALEVEACECFISLTHDKYKESLEPEAFEYITGFFSDEVHFPLNFDIASIPWTDRLLKFYEERYKENLLEKIPSLFMKVNDYREERYKFWELVTDTIVEGYYKPLEKWGKENNKKMTAHCKGEETPVFQLPYSGSCFQVLKSVPVPAIDALERYPGNNYYPRIAYSTAHQFGDGECFAEAFGGSGWGVCPDDLINYISWLTNNGIKIFAIHLNHLSLKSLAIRDWPPSIPCHLTWKDCFPDVLTQIRIKAEKNDKLPCDPDILLVTPTRKVMSEYEPWEMIETNQHNGSNPPDTVDTRIGLNFISIVEQLNMKNIVYELTEERIIEEHARITNGVIHIGKRQYTDIFISDDCFWTLEGEKIVNKISQSGVKVWKDINEYMEFKTNYTTDKKISEEKNSCSTVIPKQTKWIVDKNVKNLIMLDMITKENDIICNSIKIKSVENIEVVLRDIVKEVRFNKHILTNYYKENETYIYRIPEEVINKNDDNMLEITVDYNNEKNPIVFLRGKFAVVSASDFKPSKNDEVVTGGPFELTEIKDINNNDLITSGYPFCFSPIILNKTIEIDDPKLYSKIVLTEVKGAAAKVTIDYVELGWCWGPNWSLELPADTNIGKHDVTVELYSNTYNVFGPHHYIDGDRHVISPAQYEGVKNFADREDAPENTHHNLWTFKSFSIGDLIELRG